MPIIQKRRTPRRTALAAVSVAASAAVAFVVPSPPAAEAFSFPTTATSPLGASVGGSSSRRSFGSSGRGAAARSPLFRSGATATAGAGPLCAFDPSFLHDVPAFADAAAASVPAFADSAASSAADLASTCMSGVGSAFDSASTFLIGHVHIPEYDKSNPVEVFLHSPTPWSVIVMLSIVSLLVAWEEFVKGLREGLPDQLMSVVDSMLAEMGGLGFIGIFLGVFVTGGVLGGTVGDLSERFLGEEEILLETFEFLHTVFFEVGIGFFAICGLTVFAVLSQIKQLTQVSELALDTDGDGEVSLEEMADALHVETMVVDANGDGILDDDEITEALRHAKKITPLEDMQMGDAERGAEALVIRERLIRNLGLPDNFKIEYYFERIFAHELEEIVELSPLTWLPLIPLIALDNTVDLSHEVISAASANAAESSGWFLHTPWFFYPTLAVQLISVAWGLFNFWKLANIKVMLLPTLVRDGADDGPARLLPPRYEDEELMANFDSSPPVFRQIESFFASRKGLETTNDHQRLFGAAGAAGPSLYRDSVKFHVWLCVAQIVFFGGQIVVRDAWALLNPEITIGNPDFVTPELIVFSVFVAISGGLLYLAPTTFLNYCFASSIETMTRGWAMDKAKVDSKIHAEMEAEMLAAVAERKKAVEDVDVFEGEGNYAAAVGGVAAVVEEKNQQQPTGVEKELPTAMNGDPQATVLQASTEKDQYYF